MTYQKPEQSLDLRAKKSLGQNFLCDELILDRIADAGSISGEHIIEVGPWHGALTWKIVERWPKTLISVELDRSLVTELNSEKIARGLDSWEIVHADILGYTPSPAPYSVVANIPYYITSPILFRFLTELDEAPEEMVILMQREVAEKIEAGGKIKPSYLSLLIEYRCESITRVIDVPPTAFKPAPKVTSRVLKFVVKRQFDRSEYDRLEKLLSAAFRSPRKKVASNLLSYLPGLPWRDILKAAQITENARAEDISLKTWLAILRDDQVTSSFQSKTKNSGSSTPGPSRGE